MKRIIVMTALILIISGWTRRLNAQVWLTAPSWKVIPSMSLAVSKNMTTNLIFPYGIQSVDRGSNDVLVQKAKGAENILQVKAAREAFEKTNMSVVTENGHLYSFLISYSEQNTILNIRLSKDSQEIVDSAVSYENQIREKGIDRMEAVSARIAGLKNDPHGLGDKHHGMQLYLRRLLIDEDIMYYKILLRNRTAINYDIDKLRFYIRDKKTPKRTASQELEQQPLWIWGNHKKVKGRSSATIVVALSKFTIPDKKLLYLQIMEREGGRHLQLTINNKRLIRARPVNSIK